MKVRNKIIDTGSDFSGVGAFDQALERMGIVQNKIFACDMDKYARQTYILNYGKPKYYPLDVYDRIIPKESLDVYMTSPPCQGFSMAGNRNGSILFLNSHEFIQVNKPRFFIFENVKGLLSHDKRNIKHKYGNTFNEWVNYLGGKSVNGNPTIFPHDNSVPYHIYHFVLNAKEHGIPQNRERVFIVGIRDEVDNSFSIPKKTKLNKLLKDNLQSNVNKKYYLSEKMIKNLLSKNDQDNGFTFRPKTNEDLVANCITARCFKMGADDNYVLISKEVRTEESKQKRRKTGTNNFRGKEIEFRHQDYSNTITTQLTKDHFILKDDKIRRFTPLECFRSMDFNKDFKWDVSDTQAYKQAGNSIPVGLLVKILSKLNL